MSSTTRKRSPISPTIEEILIKGDYHAYRIFIRNITAEQLKSRIKDSRGRNLPYTILDLANYVNGIEPKRGRIEEIVEHLHEKGVKTNVELRSGEAKTAKTAKPPRANRTHITTGKIPGGIASLFKNTPRRKVFGKTRRRR